ncbi:BAG domain-containing protein [Pochonia chlamydosporia 170]|uniref:BAG domain-containing protein n=1 Tax=Pochonia chlamydosporia 170 TaxID=1380566 RepID=A0A179FMK4_METCM|nr:BAG domain-containing protein [Pochonia chlamydosporia 170]OAQ66259.1 BAG domain-containing protein [Pochonia chlamydosporia 170]
MSRYGWSLNREQSSPYSSMPGGIPAVTDDDFSYITSQDLEDPSAYLGTRPGGSPPEDDVLIIKNKGVTYPAHFPAYSIGDGKLRVKDVRDRIGLMMDLSDRAIPRIKLLYKGRQLKEAAAPVRDYGVKNKSELMAVLADIRDESSEEEMVIVNDTQSGRRKNKKKKKKGPKTDGDSASSPRDSTSNVDASSPTPGAGPMKKINELANVFNTEWLPLCVKFISSPPSDLKKREDEHRKYSESILQHVLLKLDAVDSEGIPEVRNKRKELVKKVQETLKDLDIAKAS